MLMGEQWIRQISKELLQEPSNTINIVQEALGITKINLARVCSPQSVSCLVVLEEETTNHYQRLP